MVGVGDLQAVGEDLDLAADDPLLTLGQHPVQVILAGMEEDQVQLASLVAAGDAIGLARVARRPVGADHNSQGGDAAGLGGGHLGRIAPVDQPARQVPAEVDHLRPGQRLEQLGKARPHA